MKITSMPYSKVFKCTLLSTTLAFTLASPTNADVSYSQQWQLAEPVTAPELQNETLFALDTAAVRQQIQQQKQVTVVVPNGALQTFNLRPSKVLPPGLASRYPQIQSFIGTNVQNPNLTGRFDLNPKGFRAMFNHESETGIQKVYIDPEQSNLHKSYTVTPAELAKARTTFNKHAPKVQDLSIGMDSIVGTKEKKQFVHAARNNEVKYTYRLAMSAAAEYSEQHYDTTANLSDAEKKASVMAEIVSMVNRLNEIYTVELGVDFQLVENNDNVIFLDAATDPFANDSDDGGLNQGVLDAEFGVNGYDIGHIVNADGGGLAVLGALCSPGFKADGVTGSNQATGDAFWIDFVAHELGHQFGANHTFDGEVSSCGDNRANSAAFEPGAGTTIMSYAGLCGEVNVTNQVHDNYHHHSLKEINERITDIEDGFFTIANCGTATSTTNIFPVVDAGNDYIIPANTYFRLSGNATDADGDTLSYSWEQADRRPTGAASRDEAETDSGTGPLFRAYSPRSTPERYFPSLNFTRTGNLSSGFTFTGETLPATNRDLNFVLVARDGQGGVSQDTMQIEVVDTGAAFTLLSPQANDNFTTNPITVSWDVAQTNLAPISCNSVDVVLSTNSGINFDRTLASGLPNTGSAQVNLPASETEQRFNIMQVRCSDNVFYATHTGVFSSQIEGETLTVTGQSLLSTAEETALTLSLSDFTTNLDATTLTVLAGSNYTFTGNTIRPATDFTGTLNVNVQISGNGEIAPDFAAVVSVTNVNDAPVANNDTFTVIVDSTDSLLTVLGNDTDVDADTLTITNATTDGNGSINIISPGIEYTPALGFVGTETVSYTISDGTLTSAAEAVVTVEAAPVQLLVTGQVDITGAEDTTITISADQFTTSLEVDSFVIQPGTNYTASGNTITPADNYNGTLVVDIVFTSGDTVSDPFPALVTVTEVNDPPTAENDTTNVNQDSSNNNITVLGNDRDIDTPDLIITEVSTSGNGSVTINGNFLSYTPATGFSGTETLTYTISDMDNTATATVRVNVVATPTTPPSNGGSSGGSGGSMSWFGLLALILVVSRRCTATFKK
jgi:Skp family chaperone for outer membrane proteins